MCWKQEWASAIGNLQWAIKHIERAQKKLEKRKARNDRLLTAFLISPDRYEQMKVAVRAQKNEEGIAECRAQILELHVCQDRLYGMISRYGITRRANAYGVSQRKRLKELMGGYKPHSQRKRLKELMGLYPPH